MASGIDPKQLKHEIVIPTLTALGLAQPAAINLLTGTALVESAGVYLRQIGGGPALGLWQMEPATHDDCWVNFLNFPKQAAIRDTIEGMTAEAPSRCLQLIGNLRYACALARIRYYRVPEELPAAEDAVGLSAYHKKHYNTAQGAADALTNEAVFARAISA